MIFLVRQWIVVNLLVLLYMAIWRFLFGLADRGRDSPAGEVLFGLAQKGPKNAREEKPRVSLHNLFLLTLLHSK